MDTLSTDCVGSHWKFFGLWTWPPSPLCRAHSLPERFTHRQKCPICSTQIVFSRRLSLMLICVAVPSDRFWQWNLTPSRHGCQRLPQYPIQNLIRKLDSKHDGFERKIDQVLKLHQTRLDTHDAELDSQRQLLEDLKTEVSLLRKSNTDSGTMSCDMSSDTTSTVGVLLTGGVVPAECARARLGSIWLSSLAVN